jgi:hypothetical protein
LSKREDSTGPERRGDEVEVEARLRLLEEEGADGAAGEEEAAAAAAEEECCFLSGESLVVLYFSLSLLFSFVR